MILKPKTPLPQDIKNRIIRRCVKKIALLLAVYAVLYYSIIIRCGYSYFSVRIGVPATMFVFAALLILPPFITGLVQMFCIPSYEGEVVSVHYQRKPRPWHAVLGYAQFLREQCIAVRAEIRLSDGEVIQRLVRIYDQDDPAADLCKPGDFVRYYRGTRFTQILSRAGRHDVDCVMCGRYCPKEEIRCARCGATLIKEQFGISLGPESVGEKPVSPFVSASSDEALIDARKNQQRVTKSGMTYSQPVPIERDPIPQNGPAPVHTQRYVRQIEPMDWVIYFVQIMAVYVITSYFTLSARISMEQPRNTVILCLILSGMIPMIFSVYFLRKMPSAHFCDKKGAWFTRAMSFLLPCELLRVVISALPISYNSFGGFFSPVANLLWRMFYAVPAQRVGQIALGFYIPADYVVYVVCVFVTFVIRVSVLTAFYGLFWRGCARERAKLLQNRMEI